MVQYQVGIETLPYFNSQSVLPHFTMFNACLGPWSQAEVTGDLKWVLYDAATCWGLNMIITRSDLMLGSVMKELGALCQVLWLYVFVKLQGRFNIR